MDPVPSKSSLPNVTWADVSARPTGHDIASAAGLTMHAVRYYVRRGLLKRAELRGKDSVYEAGALVRVLAIRKLTAQSWTLDDIRRHLAKRSAEELAAMVGLARPDPPPKEAGPPAAGVAEPAPEVPAKEGLPPADAAVERTTYPLAAGPSPEPDAASLASSEPWSRVTLLPGLELHLRADATPFVRRIALEIATAYRADAP